MKKKRKSISLLCECGCGDWANEGKRFISGHNNPWTLEERKRASQRFKYRWRDPNYREKVLQKRKEPGFWEPLRKAAKEKKQNSPIRKRLRENVDAIIKLYQVDRWTLRRIGNKYGVNNIYISELLRENNIEITDWCDRNREPISEEGKENMRKGHARRDLSSYRRGWKQPKEGIYKGIATRLGLDFEWLLQFGDLERLKVLNHAIHRERDYGEFNNGKRKVFIENFYDDPQFISVFNIWIENDKHKLLKPSIDHIIPRVNGGTNNIDNFQFLPLIENRAKSDLSQKEWNEIKGKILQGKIFVRGF